MKQPLAISALTDFTTGTAASKQAHDLRNVVYLASSFAQLMLEGLSGPVSSQQKEQLGHIVDCMACAQELLVPMGRSRSAA